MQANEVLQVLIEFGIVYLFFYVFVFVGHFFLKSAAFQQASFNTSSYCRFFWSFIAGLFIVISLYSIAVTKGRTINVIVLPLLYFLYRKNEKDAFSSKVKSPLTVRSFYFAEVGLVALLSIIILHLFPESEYKQADSFFYLKIVESLNLTGQENISHYNNVYSANFHGLEPYHHFEIWITAFIIRFTQGFFPSIHVERFITYGILITGSIVGLYYLVEEFIEQKISVAQKIFCWSLLFILPNLLGFFPWLYNIFISDFEGNLLERPNFRIIYLLFIPVLIELHKHRTLNKKALYLLLLLSIVSFKCTLVILPALLFYGIFLGFKKDPLHRLIWLPLIVFSLAFAALYGLFPANKVPSIYGADFSTFLLQTLHGWKFILYSIVTSIIYIIILLALFLLPLYIVYRKDLFVDVKRLLSAFLPLIITGVIGLLMARILYLKDNAYQFLFITHILITLFIWLVYLVVLSHKSKPKFYVFASVFLSLVFLVKLVTGNEKPVDTFVQNGNYVYGGAKYSAAYLREVKDYFKLSNPSVGGYIADTNFYKNTYYSRRNPNVYFLPVTYIVASGRNRNFEFCLSDTAAINYQLENPLFKDYLQNAVNRSFFYQYRLKYSTLSYEQIIEKFITEFKLSYLVVTKDCQVGNLKKMVKKEVIDPNTGERFLIL